MSFVPYDYTKDSYLGDPASSTVFYYGYYNPTIVQTTGGVVDTSKAQFLVLKVTKDVSGNILSWKWASRTYDQIWDNRASLTYV